MARTPIIVASARGVKTGAGVPDYWIITDTEGRTHYVSGRLDREPRVGSIKTLDIENPYISLTGIDKNTAQLENKFYNKFGESMPTMLWEDIKKNPTSAKAKEMSAAIDSGTLNYNREAGTVYLDDKVVTGKTPEELNALKDLGLVTAEQITNAATAAEEAARPKPEPYKFEMPTEFTTIEELANKTVSEGMPEFQPTLATDWEKKLEEVYAPTREKLKTNMADYWASLFPQGGGSGKQVVANQQQLQELEQNKLQQALGFAGTDLANKIAQFQLAQQQLSDIGGLKTAASQFGSAQDFQNYWQGKNLGWQQNQFALQQMYDQQRYNQQAELAKYLAEVSKPKSKQWYEDPNVLGSVITTAGKIIMSSRDYKNTIADSDIDTLSMIKDLDIKTYKYNGEDKERIGIISEDTPDLLTTSDKKALDVVNLFGALLDAVKKLTIRLERLEAVNG